MPTTEDLQNLATAVSAKQTECDTLENQLMTCQAELIDLQGQYIACLEEEINGTPGPPGPPGD